MACNSIIILVLISVWPQGSSLPIGVCDCFVRRQCSLRHCDASWLEGTNHFDKFSHLSDLSKSAVGKKDAKNMDKAAYDHILGFLYSKHLKRWETKIQNDGVGGETVAYSHTLFPRRTQYFCSLRLKNHFWEWVLVQVKFRPQQWQFHTASCRQT